MYIDIPARTLDAWGAWLSETELDAVSDITDCWEPEDELTPGEVLEALIEWYGGLASAYQVKSLISRIYGIEL